jgi:hypothetical protein
MNMTRVGQFHPCIHGQRLVCARSFSGVRALFEL